MKNFILASIALVSANCFSQVNSFNERTNLKINSLLAEKEGVLDSKHKPLLVIDGKPVLKNGMASYIKLMPEDIINVIALNEKTGTAIWGSSANEGVVLIKTNQVWPAPFKTMEQSIVLYVYDDKIIPKEEAEKLNTINDIAAIDVYKEHGTYRLFDDREYDAIMVLKSKGVRQ